MTAATPDPFSAHRPYLLRFARLRLADGALVEDLVQDTLLAALQGAAAFDHRASVRTWLTSILLHRIADSQRRRLRSPVLAQPDGPAGDEADADAPMQAAAIDWHDPARLLEGRQQVGALGRWLDELPPLARRVFALRELEGLDNEAAARQLGLTPARCALLLHRTRARLRARLAG